MYYEIYFPENEQDKVIFNLYPAGRTMSRLNFIKHNLINNLQPNYNARQGFNKIWMEKVISGSGRH
jgi:beta-xylosidase